MANNVTNTLTATITVTEDTTGNVPINRGLGNQSNDSNYGEFTTFRKLAAGDNTIDIPNGKAFQVYVKNNDPALFLIVKYTPTTGAQQVSPALGPGEIFILWQVNTNAAATAGITALVINASGANALTEYFLGD
jgi:hypothetical protein